MSAHSTYQPQIPFMQWLERRLPIASLVYSSFVAYPTPRNLNYWWTFGGILTFMLGVQIVTGIVLAMHYTPHVDFAFNSVEGDHARRELWLAVALPACQRRRVLLPRRLCPHRARHVLRLLQGAARGVVDPRRHPVPAHGGHRLHGLRAAVGPDELLGGDRHHQPVLGDPRRRRPDRDLAVGRLCGRQSDAQSLLLAALPVAVRHRRRGRAACLGAAHGRTEQPDRRRAEDREGHRRVHALRHGQGCLLHRPVLHRSSPGSSSTSRTISAIPTITFRPIRGQTPTHIVPEWYYLPFYAILRAIPSKLIGVIALLAASIICSPSCPGSIPRVCVRRITGRSTGSS